MSLTLARTMRISLAGDEIDVETPLLVPSFSSKARRDIKKVYASAEEILDTPFLISAYDLNNGLIQKPAANLAGLVFLDSGGYEISKDTDVMEPHYPPQRTKVHPSQCTKEWRVQDYCVELAAWDHATPTVAISFDHPKIRQLVPDQIGSALTLFQAYPQFGTELLLKPETDTQEFLKMKSITDAANEFGAFDIIGVTDKELGNSTLNRMVNITKLRIAMRDKSINNPIHVFGSLDPIITPLYFLAGADIFDGLSWIRFSFCRGLLVHHEDSGVLRYGVQDRDLKKITRALGENLHYLNDLQTQMQTFLLDDDFEHFDFHAGLLRGIIDQWRVKVKDII